MCVCLCVCLFVVSSFRLSRCPGEVCLLSDCACYLAPTPTRRVRRGIVITPSVCLYVCLFVVCGSVCLYHTSINVVIYTLCISAFHHQFTPSVWCWAYARRCCYLDEATADCQRCILAAISWIALRVRYAISRIALIFWIAWWGFRCVTFAITFLFGMN